MAKFNVDSGPKRREDDCDMVTSLQETELSKNELCLHEAARAGSIELVEKIIRKNAANINCRNNLDRTALHMAASQGHKAIVEKLLNAKAQLDIADKYGMTPLLWAAYFGRVEVFETLLARGANISKKNKQGCDVLHLAVDMNHGKMVECILTKHRNFKRDEPDNVGLTPFLLGVSKGSADAVKVLIDRGSDCTRMDKTGKNLWHFLAINGCIRIMDFFEREDHILIKIKNKDNENFTPIYYACENNHLDAVEKLIQFGAGIDDGCKYGMYPIHVAAQKNHEEIVYFLLTGMKRNTKDIPLSGFEKADIDVQNDQGNTALHLATLANLPSMVSLLLANGASKVIPNKRQQTPLHAGVEQNKCDAVEILLLNDAPMNLIDKTGKTPLLMAAKSSYISMVDMLIKADLYHERRKQASVENPNNATSANGDMGAATFRPSDADKVYNIDDEELKKSVLEPDNFRLKLFNQPYAEEFKLYLWKIAFNHLRIGEWKKLALFWGFKPEHILAIEYQNVQANSYKYHAYRVLCIWFHGVDATDTPIRGLYEALVSIGRRKLADKIRRELDVSSQKNQITSSCIVT